LDAVRTLRRPPFAEDGHPSASTTNPDAERLWRARAAEAAKRAADELPDEPQLKRLRTDLEDLQERLASEDDGRTFF
jgi:hypothetical protein